MPLYNTMIRHILLPAYQLATGRHFLRYQQELERTQWLKPGEIEELQLKKLRALLRHAARDVPYYHDLFRKIDFDPEITSLKDLERIPPITKDIIRENFPERMTSGTTTGKLLTAGTSGTTGKPLTFYWTLVSHDHCMAALNRGFKWAGKTDGDKHAVLWGSAFDISREERFVNRVKNTLWRKYFYPAFDMTEENMRRTAEGLRRLKPRMLEGYTDALFFFANYCERHGIDDLRPRAISPAGSTLFDTYREKIEAVFDAPVYNKYGSREFFPVAHECEELNHMMHITAENQIMEMVREGSAVAPGEMGEILITDLNNYGMPFIRYRMEDVGIPTDERCACGRGLPLVREVLGRNTDIFTCPDGRFVSGSFFPHLFKEYPWVAQFQAVQERKDMIFLKIVKDRGTVEESELDGGRADRGTSREVRDREQDMRRKIKEYFGEDMGLEIEYVDEIRTGPSGKYRNTMSKVPIRFN